MNTSEPDVPTESITEKHPLWLERYDYVVARAEAFFDQHRERPGYDFSKKGGCVENQQKATELAYRQYAAGGLTLAGVEAQVKMLRDAYRR